MNGIRIAAVALAAAGVLSLGTGASAEHRDRYGREAGYERGLRDGAEHGRKDAEKHRRYDVARDDDYRDADNGYKGRYGSRWDYAASYRRGYERGYRQGFSAFASRYGDRGSRYGQRYGYPWDAYDYQRDGRHHHRDRRGWCHDDHDRYDRYDGVTREIPRW